MGYRLLKLDRIFLSLQVGLNKGDGVLYYEHPLSLSSGVVYINSQTNVGVEGRFMMRVDGKALGPGECSLPPIMGKRNIAWVIWFILIILGRYLWVCLGYATWFYCVQKD